MRRRGALAATLCVLASALVGGPADAQDRARFATRVLALVPAPGFPALAYVHPNGRIYAGTYVNMSGSSAPSKVFEYTGEGTRTRAWTVPGQNVEGDQGVQVTTSDSRGRLVVLDRDPSRALLLDRRTGDFSVYSTFADLPNCLVGRTAPNCSPSVENGPAVPNYGAWGPDGSLYVTDLDQAVVWRVPPGGGPAVIWLADRRLDGGMFGTTGIALAADQRTLLVAQGSSAGLGSLTAATGKIYSIPIAATGGPGPLRQIYESRAGDLPDGFAIASSGRIYVPLVGLPQQIAVLSPEGRELERFPRSAGSGDNGSPVPFDSPSSARFLGTRLIVANQSAVAGDPANQALLDVEVGETGLLELIPGLDRSTPVISRASLTRKRLATRRRGARARRGRKRRTGTRIRLRLSERARVTVRVAKRRRDGFEPAGDFTTRTLRAGRRSLVFRGRVRGVFGLAALRPGTYRFVLTARDAGGNTSKRTFLRFRVVR